MKVRKIKKHHQKYTIYSEKRENQDQDRNGENKTSRNTSFIIMGRKISWELLQVKKYIRWWKDKGVSDFWLTFSQWIIMKKYHHRKWKAILRVENNCFFQAVLSEPHKKI